MSARSNSVWRSVGGHRVRPATWADAASLAPRLRQADLAEIQAASGEPPRAALERALALSTRAFAIEHRDSRPGAEPLALFGVADHPLGPELGAPWLLAGGGLPKIARALLREAAPWISVLGEGRLALANCADARNHLHLRWLRLLGFSRVRRVERWGVEGRTFIEFIKLTGIEGEGDHV